jgi:hypothetical protein
LKLKWELRARFSVGLTEYVDAREPVNGVSVSVNVYGNDEWATFAGVTRVEDRAAEVPAKGFDGDFEAAAGTEI